MGSVGKERGKARGTETEGYEDREIRIGNGTSRWALKGTGGYWSGFKAQAGVVRNFFPFFRFFLRYFWRKEALTFVYNWGVFCFVIFLLLVLSCNLLVFCSAFLLYQRLFFFLLQGPWACLLAGDDSATFFF